MDDLAMKCFYCNSRNTEIRKGDYTESLDIAVFYCKDCRSTNIETYEQKKPIKKMVFELNAHNRSAPVFNSIRPPYEGPLNTQLFSKKLHHVCPMCKESMFSFPYKKTEGQELMGHIVTCSKGCSMHGGISFKNFAKREIDAKKLSSFDSYTWRMSTIGTVAIIHNIPLFDGENNYIGDPAVVAEVSVKIGYDLTPLFDKEWLNE